ncbi:nucleotidyltransferase family protein [Paucibacter sp. APW11]|uniref:Nucleotidyltransferase family protein n=1 Tax=Roseateles aquae TaxID=3077235 RepID=A0ABU3PI92_9BURK|nr:nucleotidyltransferase family protein [Paucibacter sp. APW11]MDT9002280.1 nucleotidyltransferase family protein [Paucibacter sp. APW11]
MTRHLDHKAQLAALAQASPWLRTALCAVQQLGLPQWCIGAGAVRNLVWDALHGHETPTPLSDVDVAFFDADDVSPERDARLQAQLQQRLPALPWEVTNQAGVHLWFEACFGHAVAPLTSLEDAVASWPECATAVGLTLTREGAIEVIAPHGLDDLFAMVVRRNPARVSVETYRLRVAGKRYLQRWPRVTVLRA